MLDRILHPLTRPGAAALCALALALPALAGAAATAPAVPAAAGLERLWEGNARFAAGTVQHPTQSAERRTEVAAGQHPFAIVVSCSDSRVPPELVFDQGLGDLFVVRTAGQVVDSVALGSIEFAVAKLGARAIVVLGHERCGAVQAALERTPVAGSIGAVVAPIIPAVGGPAKATPETMDVAVSSNVRAIAQHIRTASPVLAPLFEDGSLAIAGAVYDLDSGKVEKLTATERR